MSYIPYTCPCCGSTKWVRAAENNSKSGFSDRIAGFFRSLFGTTELYEY
jgi:hypothetical protein